MSKLGKQEPSRSSTGKINTNHGVGGLTGAIDQSREELQPCWRNAIEERLASSLHDPETTDRANPVFDSRIGPGDKPR
jgi:hypothetical protein